MAENRDGGTLPDAHTFDGSSFPESLGLDGRTSASSRAP
jgi:hypothetical protein